ncbi:MAG TPA: LPXTG cell wall anchor domain-containing protein [Chitinophagaceae bacterium]
MLSTLNLRGLKNMDISEVKTQAKKIGRQALKQVKHAGGKKMIVAGRSVNPFLLGGAALALIGGVYLLMRRRRNILAGHTEMQHQVHPVK